MNEAFHDWLSGCPVQWFRGKVHSDSVDYTFIKPENISNCCSAKIEEDSDICSDCKEHCGVADE